MTERPGSAARYAAARKCPVCRDKQAPCRKQRRVGDADLFVTVICAKPAEHAGPHEDDEKNVLWWDGGRP